MKDCITCKYGRFSQHDNGGTCYWRAPRNIRLSKAHRNIYPMIDRRFPHKNCPAYKRAAGAGSQGVQP